jgi:hypothetical protein
VTVTRILFLKRLPLKTHDSNMPKLLLLTLLILLATACNPGSVNNALDRYCDASGCVSANFYIKYLQQNVFQPIGVTGADCKPAANSHPALYYPFPPGTTPGNEGGDWTLACGSGGWGVTAGNLYLVLSSLIGNNTLLTDAQKTLMNKGCLGWDCSVQTQTDYVGKNGLLVNAPTGGFELNTFIGIFKGKLPFMLIINSDPGQNITGLVANAFAGAGIA